MTWYTPKVAEVAVGLSAVVPFGIFNASVWFTCNDTDGLSIPIPIFPSFLIIIRRVPVVWNHNSSLSAFGEDSALIYVSLSVSPNVPPPKDNQVLPAPNPSNESKVLLYLIYPLTY